MPALYAVTERIGFKKLRCICGFRQELRGFGKIVFCLADYCGFDRLAVVVVVEGEVLCSSV